MSNEPLDAAVALRWLRRLEKNNERPWFNAHRALYDETLKPGWEDLVTALIVAATSFDPRFAYVDPRACLFRLHRDIRFSSDKTPYKTELSAFLSPFGKNGMNSGFYVSLSPGGETLFAAGLYTPTKEVLQALREHFAGANLRAFDRITAAKRLRPYLPIGTDALMRMPRGFPKEHRRGELIRARRYMIRRTYTDKRIVSDGLFATFRAAMRDCAPFVAYLDRIATQVTPTCEGFIATADDDY